MYNILIVGAGYLGTAIARDFKAKKQRVFALTRNAEKAAALEREEIQPVLADLTRPETLEKIPPAHFIVLCAAPEAHDEEAYRRIYLDGIKNFLESQRNRPRPYLVVGISSTSVWRDRAGEWVDESTPVDPETVKGRILLASEQLILGSGYPAIIYRLSGIYGPGRNRLSSFRSGKWPEAGMPDAYMNMMHVEDIARSMLPLFKQSKEGEIYIGTDNAPVRRSDFVHWLEQRTGRPSGSKMDTAKLEGKKCRNSHLRQLGFEFLYPSFREGYESILTKEG